MFVHETTFDSNMEEENVVVGKWQHYVVFSKVLKTGFEAVIMDVVEANREKRMEAIHWNVLKRVLVMMWEEHAADDSKDGDGCVMDFMEMIGESVGTSSMMFPNYMGLELNVVVVNEVEKVKMAQLQVWINDKAFDRMNQGCTVPSIVFLNLFDVLVQGGVLQVSNDYVPGVSVCPGQVPEEVALLVEMDENRFAIDIYAIKIAGGGGEGEDNDNSFLYWNEANRCLYKSIEDIPRGGVIVGSDENHLMKTMAAVISLSLKCSPNAPPRRCSPPLGPVATEPGGCGETSEMEFLMKSSSFLPYPRTPSRKTSATLLACVSRARAVDWSDRLERVGVRTVPYGKIERPEDIMDDMVVVVLCSELEEVYYGDIETIKCFALAHVYWHRVVLDVDFPFGSNEGQWGWLMSMVQSRYRWNLRYCSPFLTEVYLKTLYDISTAMAAFVMGRDFVWNGENPLPDSRYGGKLAITCLEWKPTITMEVVDLSDETKRDFVRLLTVVLDNVEKHSSLTDCSSVQKVLASMLFTAKSKWEWSNGYIGLALEVVSRKILEQILEKFQGIVRVSEILMEGSTCAICLGGEKQDVIYLGCGHLFCLDCLSAHLKVRTFCPMCRRELVKSSMIMERDESFIHEKQVNFDLTVSRMGNVLDYASNSLSPRHVVLGKYAGDLDEDHHHHNNLQVVWLEKCENEDERVAVVRSFNHTTMPDQRILIVGNMAHNSKLPLIQADVLHVVDSRTVYIEGTLGVTTSNIRMVHTEFTADLEKCSNIFFNTNDLELLKYMLRNWLSTATTPTPTTNPN